MDQHDDKHGVRALVARYPFKQVGCSAGLALAGAAHNRGQTGWLHGAELHPLWL